MSVAERTATPSEGRRAEEIIAQVACERSLSGREHEVLARAARGESTKHIAYALGISGSTVAYYWAQIFRKVGCRSQIEVMTLLFQRAVIPPNAIDRERPADLRATTSLR